MREIVQDWLDSRNREGQRRRELKALEELTRLQRQIEDEAGIYQGDLLEDSQAGREEDLGRVWRGEE